MVTSAQVKCRYKKLYILGLHRNVSFQIKTVHPFVLYIELPHQFAVITQLPE